jgi:hypothetical protein
MLHYHLAGLLLALLSRPNTATPADAIQPTRLRPLSSGASSLLSPSLLPPWEQDAFFISFWVGPQVADNELDERFAELAEGNFTGYMGFNDAGADRVRQEIELCDKHGLKCAPSLCGAKLGSIDSPCATLGENSPNFWGFQLLDEPFGQSADPFDYRAIGSWTRSLAARRPTVSTCNRRPLTD